MPAEGLGLLGECMELGRLSGLERLSFDASEVRSPHIADSTSSWLPLPSSATYPHGPGEEVLLLPTPSPSPPLPSLPPGHVAAAGRLPLAPRPLPPPAGGGPRGLHRTPQQPAAAAAAARQRRAPALAPFRHDRGWRCAGRPSASADSLSLLVQPATSYLPTRADVIVYPLSRL